MTAKRMTAVVIAVVAGLAAAGLSYWYLHDAQSRAYHNATLVPAYVTAKPIPRGLDGQSAITGGYFSRESIPNQVRPASAVTDLSRLANLEAVAPVATGQVLVNGMFVSATQAASTFAQQIPSGEVAVAVAVDQIHGVANLVQPGDKVDIMLTLSGAENLFMQNVAVLAVGQSSVPQGGSATTSSTSSGLITFAVTPGDAVKIALAESQNLGIYLALVPPGNPVVTTPSVTPDQLG